VKVHASYEAGTYIRERGGRLYVWLRPVSAAFGTIRVSTEAPKEAPRLDQVDAGGFELFVDRELERPHRVDVSVRRWPRRRLRVRGFGPGAPTPGDGLIWDSAGSGGGGDGGGGGGGNGGGG
jgi:hypothetical protein